MFKFFNLNNNICDQILNEVQVHFTKSCPNKCPFCIDAFNNGISYKKPDIDKIFMTIISISDKIDEVTISGGEPFLYIEDLYTLCYNIKKYTNKKLTVITSLPVQCYTHKNTFFNTIKTIDKLIISPQHMNNDIGDKIRGHKIEYNREELLRDIPDKSKVSLTLNLIKGCLETKEDLISNIKYFESFGFSSFKISEMFDHDELYVSIEDTLGIKLKQPFSYGCSDKHYNMNDILGYESKSDFTIKRVCFYRTKHKHANFSDLLKILIRPFFSKKYFFGVIYENGEILPRWI